MNAKNRKHHQPLVDGIRNNLTVIKRQDPNTKICKTGPSEKPDKGHMIYPGFIPMPKAGIHCDRFD
jgi:hypothetical protein